MCQHEAFQAEVSLKGVYNKTNTNQIDYYRLVVKCKCLSCGNDFEFMGLPAGLSSTSPTTYPDSKTLNAPVQVYTQDQETRDTPAPTQRVTYSQALKLYGLGYKDHCRSFYRVADKALIENSEKYVCDNSSGEFISAPSLNEVIEWMYSKKQVIDVSEGRAKIIGMMGDIIATMYEEEVNNYEVMKQVAKESGGSYDKRPFLKRLEEMIDALEQFKRINNL